MSDNGSNHRLHYFNNQFLLAKDFADEQEYHLYKRRLHNRTLHTPGISEGLDVQIDPKDSKTLTVSKGIAIDRNGNEIVLRSEQRVPLPPQPSDLSSIVYVSIAYSEEPPKDKIPEFEKMWQPEGADRDVSNQYTRTIEKAVLKASWSEDKEAIQLAKYHVTSKALDLSVRLRSSAKLSATQDLTTPEANSDQVYPTAKAVKSYVDTRKPANNSITGSMIAEGAITNKHFTRNTIDASVINPKSITITNSMLASDAVSTDKIIDRSITLEKLDLKGTLPPLRFSKLSVDDKIGIGTTDSDTEKAKLQINEPLNGVYGGYIKFFNGIVEMSYDGGEDGWFSIQNTCPSITKGGTTFINTKGEPLLRIANNGTLTSKGIATDSSRALKTNVLVISFDEALSILENLQPVTFTYHDDSFQKMRAGFIAEDLPELVTTRDRQAVYPLDIVAILTKVVQQQQEQLKILDKRLNALEARTDPSD